MNKLFKNRWRARAIISVALCLPMLSGLAIAGNAKNQNAEVRWGTPVIDGKLDSAYLRSASMSMITPFYCPWDDKTGAEKNDPLKEAADVEGTAYFLWSEDYFYTCTIVKDNDLFKRDPSFYTTPYPWKDDGCEGWYSYNKKSFGLHTDAYGVVMYAYAGSSNGGLDAFADVPAIGADFAKPSLSNIDCKSKEATTITSDGYIVEVAIKLRDDAQYKTGDIMKYAMQINDVFDEEATRGYAIGSQDCFNSGINLTFVEKTEEDVAACAVAAEDPGAPVADSTSGGNASNANQNGAEVSGGTNSGTAGTTDGTVNKTSNPGTSDIGVYIAAAVVASATAFVVATAKRRK